MRATIVKALAVLAVGLAGAGCSSMPAPIGPSETTFTADFANIAGMYAGNEVSILGLPVGSIACGAGWQAAGQTLSALRAIVHALRGWPTPIG